MKKLFLIKESQGKLRAVFQRIRDAPGSNFEPGAFFDPLYTSFQNGECGAYQGNGDQQRQAAGQQKTTDQGGECNDKKDHSYNFGKTPGDLESQTDDLNEQPDKRDRYQDFKH